MDSAELEKLYLDERAIEECEKIEAKDFESRAKKVLYLSQRGVIKLKPKRFKTFSLKKYYKCPDCGCELTIRETKMKQCEKIIHYRCCCGYEYADLWLDRTCAYC